MIRVEQGAVSEFIPIAAAPHALTYSSDRQVDRTGDFTVVVPLTGSTVDSDLSQITVTLQIAGRTLSQTYPAQSNLTHTFVWDGLDASSNLVQGRASYILTVDKTWISGAIDYPLRWLGSAGIYRASHYGLGGWGLTTLHFYNRVNQTIFFGDGSVRSRLAQNLSGGNVQAFSDDGLEAYVFGADGRHLETRNGLTGALIYTFHYDSSNRLIKISDSYGKETLFNRTSGGDLDSITAPYGQVTEVSLDANGYISQVTNPNNESYTMTYHGTGGLIASFTNPSNQTSTFTYNAQGYLTRDTGAFGDYKNFAYSFDAYRRFITMTTRLNLQSTYESAFHTDPVIIRKRTMADGKENETFSYREGVSQNVTFAGGSSQLSFTNDIRLSSRLPVMNTFSRTINGIATQNQSLSQSITWGSGGSADIFGYVDLTNQRTVSGQNWTEKYYRATGVTEYTSPSGIVSSIVTNPIGQVTSVSYPSVQTVNYTYDTDGRITLASQGARDTSYTYSTSGFLSQVTNAEGEMTQFQRDPVGRITQITLPDTRIVSMSYDANGNLSGLTPPGRPSHSFLRNLLDAISEYLPPALGLSTVKTEYTYNLDGKLSQIKRPDLQTIGFQYNSLSGLLSRINLPGSVFNEFNYSAGFMTWARSYDNIFVDITGERLPTAFRTRVGSDTSYLYGQVNFTYNANFQPASIAVKESSNTATSTVNLTYNTDQNLSQIGDETITRNATTGFVTGTTLGNVTEAYTYNAYGEVASYTASYSGTPIYTETYTRDLLGRITSLSTTESGVTETQDYTYDLAGRLTRVDYNGGLSFVEFTYDSNSNITSYNRNGTITTATYDNQDRMLTYGNYTYTHNLNGELQTRTDTSTSTTETFSYDVLGNLKQYARPGTSTIDYVVDGFNRRVGRRVAGSLNKIFVYQDQLRIAAEMDSAGKFISRFVYSVKPNVPSYLRKGTTNYKIVSSHLGSPRLVVNASTGTVEQRITYDVLGKVMLDTNPDYQPFGFAGGIWDATPGLIRFGARDYDPETGRWTAKDPVRFNAGDTNLFGYVFADPVNFVDPAGTIPIALAPIAAITAGSIVGGVTTFLGTRAVGGSISQSLRAGAVGAIGGAGATTIAILSGGSALATGFGLALDFGFTSLMLPSNLPDSKAAGEVVDGLKKIGNNQSCN